MPARSPRQIRLESWHLRGFPFPTTPVADPFSTDSLINGAVFDPSLRQEEIELICSKVLGNGWTDEIKSWRWLWARKNRGRNLGMGKTALLGYVTREINRDYGDSFLRKGANWLAIYTRIEPETNSVAKMVALVLAGLCNSAQGTSVEQLLLAKSRQRALSLRNLHHHIERPGAITTRNLLDERWLADHGVDLAQLAVAIEGLLVENQYRVTPEIAKAFAHGSLMDYLTELNHYQNLRAPGLSLINRSLSLLLDDVAKIAKAAEISHVTIFLDDMYFLVRRTPAAERYRLAQELRKLAVDGHYYSVTESHFFNWVAVMHTQTASFFSAAWKDASMNSVESLDYRSDDAEGIFLRMLRYEEGREILEAYLKNMHRREAPSVCHPFTPEALEEIAFIIGERGERDEVHFAPRDLLPAAHRVLSAALERDDITPPISVDYVRHVLQHAPLPKIAESSDDEDEIPEEEGEPLDRVCACSCHQGEEARDIIPVLGGTDQVAKSAIRHYCKACEKEIALSS